LKAGAMNNLPLSVLPIISKSQYYEMQTIAGATQQPGKLKI